VSDNDDKPAGPDRLVDLGPCGADDGEHHMLALKEGQPVGLTHMRPVVEGQPLPADGNVYWTDKSGRVVDSMRLGKGPAQVATPEYRTGWDAIFGQKKAEGLN
jgi:hypothetical protein